MVKNYEILKYAVAHLRGATNISPTDTLDNIIYLTSYARVSPYLYMHAYDIPLKTNEAPAHKLPRIT